MEGSHETGDFSDLIHSNLQSLQLLWLPQAPTVTTMPSSPSASRRTALRACRNLRVDFARDKVRSENIGVGKSGTIFTG